MDTKTEMNVRKGYASIFEEDKADTVQDELFPDLNEVFEFNLATDADEALAFLKDSHSETGDVGVRLRNFDAPDQDSRIAIARAIKSYWEGRSFSPNTPDTVIIVSGTESLSQYEHSLAGRVYIPR